ncbi:MAG: septum formation inhibitor Maf [Burkholderiales bacterium]|jgi:septum formation protein|nr:septum formation inhibitor Maf [Burkholderiales bacterium]
MSDRFVYLASRSPRRRELLRQIGVSFEVFQLREAAQRRADIDETPFPGEGPEDYVLRVARDKAQAAAAMVAARRVAPHPVLAADTTVVLDDAILGKPADAADAARMLGLLSGRAHRVLTAVAVARGLAIDTRLSESQVWFRALAADEIRRYVASGEPNDKAGAYAVQGRAAAFITRIEGSYSGIMGLPLAETADLLRIHGILLP